MITALVQFRLSQPVTREKAKEIFLSTAPKYRTTPGLVRKYYLISEDGVTAGGVYLWKSRKDAEGLYTKEWKNFVFEKNEVLGTFSLFQQKKHRLRSSFFTKWFLAGLRGF